VKYFETDFPLMIFIRVKNQGARKKENVKTTNLV